MRLHPPTAASSRYAVPFSGRALMRRTDVPTQRRPRHRQVSQGMREGKGRTTADAASVGVGAIEILHPSPGPPSPTQTPQPNNLSPTLIPSPLRRGDRLGALPGVGWGVPSPFLKQSKPCLKLQNNQKPTPRATRIPQKSLSGVIQSKQLRVQSIFNQRSINVQSKPHPNKRTKLTPPPPHYRIKAAFGRNHHQSCAFTRGVAPRQRHAPIATGGR